MVLIALFLFFNVFMFTLNQNTAVQDSANQADQLALDRSTEQFSATMPNAPYSVVGNTVTSTFTVTNVCPLAVLVESVWVLDANQSNPNLNSNANYNFSIVSIALGPGQSHAFAVPVTISGVSSSDLNSMTTWFVTARGNKVPVPTGVFTAVTPSPTPTPTQVIYVAAGQPGMAHGGNVYPLYPGGVVAGDLIILQVLARGDNPAITVPSGFAPLPISAGWTSDSSNTAGVSRVTQGLYYKFAVGGESGEITVNVTGSYDRAAVIYAFRNVAASNFLESVTNPANIGSASTTLAAQTVTTSGSNRLAVTFIATGTNRGLAAFTGYTKQSDINVDPSGGDDSLSELGLETAAMPSQGVLNGGTQPYNTCDWIVRGFALVP